MGTDSPRQFGIGRPTRRPSASSMVAGNLCSRLARWVSSAAPWERVGSRCDRATPCFVGRRSRLLNLEEPGRDEDDDAGSLDTPGTSSCGSWDNPDASSRSSLSDSEVASFSISEEAGDDSKLRRRSRRRVRRHAWPMRQGCCVAFWIALGLTALVAAMSKLHRWRQLEPFLAALSAAELCHRAESPRCVVQLDPPAVGFFDLDSPREQELLGFLWAQVAHVDGHVMRDVMRGAYVMLPATGSYVAGPATYEWLRSTEGAYSRGWLGRGSSHDSSVEQFMVVEGDFLCCVLSGVLNNRTWLQFEGAQFQFSRLSMLWSNVMHSIDFVLYLGNFRPGAGKKGPLRLGPTVNVGPFGTAPFTDAHPLYVNYLRPTAEACPDLCPAAAAAGGVASAVGRFLRGLRLL